MSPDVTKEKNKKLRPCLFPRHWPKLLSSDSIQLQFKAKNPPDRIVTHPGALALREPVCRDRTGIGGISRFDCETPSLHIRYDLIPVTYHGHSKRTLGLFFFGTACCFPQNSDNTIIHQASSDYHYIFFALSEQKRGREE